MGAPAADAVVLLGDVGQLKKMRERTRDRNRGLERHRRELLGQLGKGARRSDRIAAPRGLGGHAYALDAIEEVLAFLADQCLAKQAAEQPDVVAQRLLRV